jgi:GNAT superfamily N-acetyltransferase
MRQREELRRSHSDPPCTCADPDAAALRTLAGNRVEVKHLFVSPKARRRGAATALMDGFEAEAARRSCSKREFASPRPSLFTERRR